jgi:hypothetical protein
MGRVTRIPRADRADGDPVAEVELLAWLLDNSIPIPATGRRIGLDAIIGLIPIAGDVASAGLGLFVVWRGARLGLPRVVVARMLLNSALDLAVGAIPLIGDAFDLWFKANTRNLRLMRRHLEEPTASTRGSWVAIGAMAAALVVVAVLIIWAFAGLIAFLLTPIG